jgi:transposase-like protein
MRFEELLERFERGSLSHGEAAAALGVSERTLRRWRQRYEEDGADGLVDRRVGNDNCVRWHGQSLQIAEPAAAASGARDRPGARLSRRHPCHLQGTAAAGELPAGSSGARQGPGRVITATRPATTTAVNPCATYCGQNSTLATVAHWATRRNAGRPPRSIQWSAFQPCDPIARASSIRASARLPRLADVSHRGTWRMKQARGVRRTCGVRFWGAAA